MKIGFIGSGTVGSALALRLSQQGYAVVAVSSKGHTSAEKLAASITGCRAVRDNQVVADAADLVFITTPDDVIPTVAASVKWHAGQSVVHCSGADSTETIAAARQFGARVGAFHPLQTFAGVKQAIENIPGSTFAIEAEEPLLATLKEMATALEGSWIELNESDKVLYHASAVIACNYLITLVKLATDLWQTFDVPREKAVHAMLPLLQGTLHNLDTVGIPQCLTGPVARGDTGTIRKHLKALEKSAPEVLATYRELGRQTVPVAEAKGRINKRQAEEMQELFQPAKTGRKSNASHA
ncbi:MAG: DUF2520 domain-containing protein [Chloroflexota bacterium]